MITDFNKSFWDTYSQAADQDSPLELARYIGQLEIWTQLADSHQADQRSKAIEVLRERLALTLADTATLDVAPHVLYRQELIKCGKAKCKRCSAGPAHGPYWYAFTTERGKTTKKYLGKELPKTFRPGRDVAHPYNPNQSVKVKAVLPIREQLPAQPQLVKSPPLRREKKNKVPPANFWLIDRQADTLAFHTREEAERWASKLNTKWKIYEARSRAEAWEQHQPFLVRQANGQAIW